MSKHPSPDDALSPCRARLLAEDSDTWTLRLLWVRTPRALRQEGSRTVLKSDDADVPPPSSGSIAALAGDVAPSETRDDAAVPVGAATTRSWSASTPTPPSRSSAPGSTRPAI